MAGSMVTRLGLKCVAGICWMLSFVTLCETIEQVSAFVSLFCVIRCSLMLGLCCGSASLASRVVHLVEAATGLESLRNLPKFRVSGKVSSVFF
uniref:Putative secreted peptide n=1 Tax=Anopheles braziliensis TaxID=58242 RepID=A0A2M3ZTM9_9DIPT